MSNENLILYSLESFEDKIVLTNKQRKTIKELNLLDPNDNDFEDFITSIFNDLINLKDNELKIGVTTEILTEEVLELHYSILKNFNDMLKIEIKQIVDHLKELKIGVTIF